MTDCDHATTNGQDERNSRSNGSSDALLHAGTVGEREPSESQPRREQTRGASAPT
jgi:hypothetical protein